MNENDTTLPATTGLTKEQLRNIDRAVPQVLQQIDPKILIQFLKNAQGSAQVNVISIGKYYSSSSGDEELIQELQEENTELKTRLQEARDGGILEWLDGLPEPKYDFMLREVIIALKNKFKTQKEAAKYFGTTQRVFSYWMKTYNVPGYKANPRRNPHSKGEEDADDIRDPV